MPITEINGHDMYYEVHGEGDPALCMTGWGTYCHGNEGGLARGLTDRYSVVVFDHRGIGDSNDDLSVGPTMKLYSDDACGLLDHLGMTNAHVIGLVGMGACIGQEMAIGRPDLVRSLTNMGAWCSVDTYLHDQLDFMRTVHRDLGFLAFQQLVTIQSFDPVFYNANRDRLLGPDKGWADLKDNYEAHSRLIDACLSHDSKDRLGQISAPALIVHAAFDQVTGPRTTLPIEHGIKGARGVMLEDAFHVIAGREMKIKFCDVLLNFLADVDAGRIAA
jgi:pimeloyl-ACP methyl ester carboxylesterase